MNNWNKHQIFSFEVDLTFHWGFWSICNIQITPNSSSWRLLDGKKRYITSTLALQWPVIKILSYSANALLAFWFATNAEARGCADTADLLKKNSVDSHSCVGFKGTVWKCLPSSGQILNCSTHSFTLPLTGLPVNYGGLCPQTQISLPLSSSLVMQPNLDTCPVNLTWICASDRRVCPETRRLWVKNPNHSRETK